MLRSAIETKFIRREGTYKTLFKDNVFPEVNLSKTFPLPITTVVVESPIYTQSLSVDSSKSCNNSLVAQNCLEAHVSSSQPILFASRFSSTTTTTIISLPSARLAWHHFVLPSLSLAPFFDSIWQLCDHVFHKQNKSP